MDRPKWEQHQVEQGLREQLREARQRIQLEQRKVKRRDRRIACLYAHLRRKVTL